MYIHTCIYIIICLSSQACILVLYGDDPVASNNILLGQFDIVNIPPAPKGVPRIEVMSCLADLARAVEVCVRVGATCIVHAHVPACGRNVCLCTLCMHQNNYAPFPRMLLSMECAPVFHFSLPVSSASSVGLWRDASL